MGGEGQRAGEEQYCVSGAGPKTLPPRAAQPQPFYGRP